jgi:hypothetical protein
MAQAISAAARQPAAARTGLIVADFKAAVLRPQCHGMPMTLFK